jgi:hypothetical protein
MPTLKIGDKSVTIGDDFLKLSPEQQSATVEEIAGQVGAQKPEGRLARIGHGLADPIYGAAQIGARMEEPTAFSTEEERQARVGAVDTAVQQREQQIQERRAPEDRGSTDWYRAFGAVPTSVALSAPAAFLGPIGGAVVGSAMGAMQQPETSQENIENFGTQKAIEGVVGGAVGLAGGLLGKGAAAVYNQVRNPAKVAFRELERAAQRDGTTIQALQEKLSAMKRVRGDATIADVAGVNVRGLVERIGQTPGAGAAKVTPRFTTQQQAQLDRLSEDLKFLTGTNRSAYEAIKTTIAERSAEAKPLWDQVRQLQNIWSPRLQEFIENPEIKAGMSRGYKIERLESLAEGREFNPTQLGVDLDDQGNIIMKQVPNMRVLHMAKMGLDDMIDEARDPLTGKLTATGVALDKTRRAFLSEIESLDRSGIYRQAREVWGGHTAYLKALEQGKKINAQNLSGEELRAIMSEMSEPEKEAYRIGAVSQIINLMKQNTAKLADYTKYVTSRAMREKVVAMMPDPVAAGEWLNKLDFEGGRTELTGLALKGSPTARRLAQQADADTIAGDLLLHALTHEPSLGTLARIMKHITPKVRDTLRSRSDSVLIDLLTTAEGAGQIPENIERAGMAPLDLAAGPLAAGRGSRTREALQ